MQLMQVLDAAQDDQREARERGERNLGVQQDLTDAPGDHLGLRL